MAEESEVGANERCTGMEPAQFADWMVVGSVLLVLLIVDVGRSAGRGQIGRGWGARLRLVLALSLG